ncbi:C40 family peptidase [Leifsonia sp. NPDC058248]|uniref:C40 family peptidase n=1 Tax=Leifsonia sp. NPDC058248 TaxID=3346402 RepID=UPI0036DA793C
MTQLGTPGSEENLPNNPNPSRSTDIVSRRSLRASQAQTSARSSAPGAVASSTATRAAKSPTTKPQSTVAPRSAGTDAPKKGTKKVKGGVINVAVMTLAAGLIATMAIPAYAFNPAGANDAQFKTSAIDGMKKAQPQSVAVSQTVTASAVSREAAGATTQAQLDAQKEAKAAQAAAEVARQQAAVQLTNYAASYSGPSVTDFLANPPYPNFSLPQVFSVAQQYIGTPYVFGGSTPAGFDCSGYVMFVYAQFGVSLPHSVSGQAALGKRISIQDAVPGDIVIMPGHDGFYAGNGNIMDAPDTGRSISIRPIWTSDYYIVRLGI